MKRNILIFLVLLFTSALFSQNFYKALEPGKEQMAVYVGSYDWGPCVNKIVINTNQLQKPETLKVSDFEIERSLYQNGVMSKGELTITDVFCSDSKGNKTDKESIYITILTDVYPEAENASPFPDFISSGVFNNYFHYKVTNDELDMEFSKCQGFVNEGVSKFTKSSYDYKIETEIATASGTLSYMFYLPPEKSDNTKIPLILWFHTIGESGNNPYLVLLGTKATNLADDTIQHYFKDGVAILAPQCPTGWLETTEQSTLGVHYWAPVDFDGPVNKITKPLSRFFNSLTGRPEEEEEETTPFAAVSYYTAPVTALLKDFLDKHPEIDRNRVYVGGASAGGYMTMNMMIQHPEFFAAAFPTCEYYLDSKISKSQIKMLAEKPMWFTYAENDETVKPSNNCVPTIKRLKEEGARNLKVSKFSGVFDLSGTVLKDRNAKEGDRHYGEPYEYEGHASWIYVLNDQCKDENGLSLFDWLSRQRLK